MNTIADHDLATLSALTVIAVIREGISPEPRQMRLEGYVWGPGSHSQAVALVCADAGEPRVTLAGSTPIADGGLEALLMQRGVLNEDDLATLRQQRHAARRVADLDGWLL